MRCPKCGLGNPDMATRCGCGFSLATQKLYGSYERMRLWDFFSNSWRTFGINWPTLLTLVLIPTLTPTTLAWIIRLLTGNVSIFTLSVISTIAGIVSGTVWIFSTMALTMAAHQSSEGQLLRTWKSYELCVGYFWQYLWTVILYALIVVGGLLLLIVPGIIWAFHYVFAPYAVLIEGVSGRPALWRSRELTKGRVFRILLIELGFGLLCLLLFHIPLRLLVSMAGGSTGDTFIGFPGPRPEWAGMIELFGQLVSAALFVIFNVLLFKSLRTMKLEANTLEEKASHGAVTAVDLDALAELYWKQGKYGEVERLRRLAREIRERSSGPISS